MEFTLVNSLAEFIQYERSSGYRGHDLEQSDEMDGDEIPIMYPVYVYTIWRCNSSDGPTYYHRTVIDRDNAWKMFWELSVKSRFYRKEWESHEKVCCNSF